MIKIEILFPEVANLFGEPFNVRYIQMSLGEECQLISTALTDEPAFLQGDVDLVYMGAMPESAQLLAIDALMPYKDVIKKQIEEGKVYLLTGNAMEVFGDSIAFDDKVEHPALGITGLKSQTDMMHRYNTLYIGNVHTDEGDVPVSAFKSTFSFSFGNNEDKYFIESVKGCGINKESKWEGVRIHNLLCTYLIGPVLVLNPELCKYVMKLMGVKEPKLAFEKENKECFDIRMDIMKQEGTKFLL